MTTVFIDITGDKDLIQYEIEVGEVALKHVLYSFNPTNDKRTEEVKVLCAALIQRMYDLMAAQPPRLEGHPYHNPHLRAAERAIELIEAAQMQTVKAFFVQA